MDRPARPHLYDSGPGARAMISGTLRVPAVMPPPDVVSLGIGEPDAPTPSPIIAAMNEALRDGYTKYGDFTGDPELRGLLAEDTSRRTGARVSGSEVVITGGASSALAAVMLALLGSGDQVVIPDPTYSLYADVVRLAGVEPVFVPRTSAGRVDIARLVDVCRDARLLVLCSPNNPTGDVISRADLHRLADGLSGTDCLVLADEAYDAYVFDGEHTPALAVDALRERTVLVHTFSKTYAMTGWRLGYIVAPPPLFPALQHTQITINGSVNSAVQRAGIAALRLGPDRRLVERYRRQRDRTIAVLRAIPGVRFTVPAGGFYVFLRYPQDIPSAEMTARLAVRGVLVRPGAEFGPSGEGAIRVSFAVAAADLELGLERLARALREH